MMGAPRAPNCDPPPQPSPTRGEGAQRAAPTARCSPPRMIKPRLAIATRDPAGIAPEISLKAALDREVNDICRPMLVGDPAAIEQHAAASGLMPTLHVIHAPGDADWSNGQLNV